MQHKWKVGAPIFIALVVIVLVLFNRSSQTPPPVNEKMSLTILIASDPHDDLEGIETVKQELIRRGITPDIVISPGDLTTMPSKLGIAPASDVLDRYTQAANAMLGALQTISPAVYWVPGNHDPDNMFQDDAHGQLVGMPVHGRMLQLAEGLHIAGFGGSVAATEGGNPSWGAYPFSDDQMSELIKPVRQAITELPPNDSLILLTHCGPLGSSTTECSSPEPNTILAKGVRENWILSGSKTLRELVESDEVQQRTILNIHGHTHNGCGVARVGGVTILNPGSVRYTKSYGLVKLQQTGAGSWRRESIEIVEF